MPDNEPVFDLERSLEAQKDGMATAAENRVAALQKAREVATQLGRDAETFSRLVRKTTYGISVEDVYPYLSAEEVTALGPAAGSIFQQKTWKFNGERKKSTRVSNHARELKCWVLRSHEEETRKTLDRRSQCQK